jgi:hypothetical protein
VVVGEDYPGSKWVQSAGDDIYRRSLYTFWKRTVPHPVMLAFDAPEREFCSVRRSRTNTPLQALVLMNEPAFLEAARQLAQRVLREGGADDAARLAYAFRCATGRAPEQQEAPVLLRSLEDSVPASATMLRARRRSPPRPNRPVPRMPLPTLRSRI